MQISENKLQLDNIDLSADKVTLNSSNIKSKNVKGALEELLHLPVMEKQNSYCYYWQRYSSK